MSPRLLALLTRSDGILELPATAVIALGLNRRTRRWRALGCLGDHWVSLASLFAGFE